MDHTKASNWYQYERTPGTKLAGPWLLSWVVSSVLLEIFSLNEGARTVVALLPLPVFGWFLWKYVRHIRALDEMHHRIELEALAIAFPLSIALLMTLGQLQKIQAHATGTPISNWFWLYLVVFYLFGRGIAQRRYA